MPLQSENNALPLWAVLNLCMWIMQTLNFPCNRDFCWCNRKAGFNSNCAGLNCGEMACAVTWEHLLLLSEVLLSELRITV